MNRPNITTLYNSIPVTDGGVIWEDTFSNPQTSHVHWHSGIFEQQKRGWESDPFNVPYCRDYKDCLLWDPLILWWTERQQRGVVGCLFSFTAHPTVEPVGFGDWEVKHADVASLNLALTPPHLCMGPRSCFSDAPKKNNCISFYWKCWTFSLIFITSLVWIISRDVWVCENCLDATMWGPASLGRVGPWSWHGERLCINLQSSQLTHFKLGRKLCMGVEPCPWMQSACFRQGRLVEAETGGQA